jgi:hypothetical protein
MFEQGMKVTRSRITVRVVPGVGKTSSYNYQSQFVVEYAKLSSPRACVMLADSGDECAQVFN